MTATRIMVYSHDAFGLGNLRRMLAICEHLLNNWPGLSVLLLSGSPMIHEFRLPKGLDYIKLPCLNRGVTGELSAKYLGTPIQETVALRSQLIHSAAIHFKPHLLLVDKKPTGLLDELDATLIYLKENLPQSKCVLLLRDILDTPEKTIKAWRQYGYCQKIQSFYDRMLVVGMRSVFDVVQSYCLPLPVAHKVRYCGYIRKPASCGMSGDEVRSQLGLGKADRLVLVTPGGGEDGHSLVHTYLQGIQQLNPLSKQHQAGPGHIYSLILSGPEMPSELSHQLHALGNTCAHVKIESFTREIFPYLKAADTIVSMGGYNTLTEILSLGKRAVVLPRTQPSKEQLIRASRFAKRDWVKMLCPEQTTPAEMMQAVIYQLNRSEINTSGVDFGGLARVLCYLRSLISPPSQPVFQSASCQFAERRFPMPVASVPASPVHYPPNAPPTNSYRCATA